MKRLLSSAAAFGVAALLLAPGAAFAQGAPAPVTAPTASGATAPHHRHQGSRYMRALRSLNLTDPQRQQIRDLMSKARTTMHGADQATRRSTYKQLRSQIDAVLTPAQRTQLQTTLQQSRGMTKPAGT